MSITMSRRRFITIAGAAVGLPLVLGLGRGLPRLARWEGRCLGAPAAIQLYHSDEAAANAAIAAGLDELKRLESIFSLYRADSALSTLNRTGVLHDAPTDFIALLSHALALARVSDGVYDPTVQPVWELYFRHFTAAQPDPAGPAPEAIAAALARMDWRAVEIDAAERRVSFARAGMGLTLNSGAQGFITDRVTEVLRARGFDRMLVDMGEPRALSTKPDGSAWRIGIANPANPTQSITSVDVVDKCVATSGGYGTLFDDAGRFTHIINTRSGKTAPALLGVSVIADSGTQADGLATTLLMAPVERRQAILRAAGGIQAIYVTPEGVAATVNA